MKELTNQFRESIFLLSIVSVAAFAIGAITIYLINTRLRKELLRLENEMLSLMRKMLYSSGD